MEGDEGSCSNEAKRMRFERICVFCGSREGYKSSYGDAARKLGKQLVEREIDLVYGGGSIGLMGLISKTVHDGGRHVLGCLVEGAEEFLVKPVKLSDVKRLTDFILRGNDNNQRKCSRKRKTRDDTCSSILPCAASSPLTLGRDLQLPSKTISPQPLSKHPKVQSTD